MRVIDSCKIKGIKIAILVNDETMEAYEAIWDETQDDWETDFSYPHLDIDSFEVAGAMDFQKVESMGYTFKEV